MIEATRKAGSGCADHHILHYLSQTQSHPIPKGQFECTAQNSEWQHETKPLCQDHNQKMVWFNITASEKELYFLIRLASAHQHDCKVKNRVRPCNGVILQANFTGPWDKAPYWFLGEKHHYRLSFILAVLGQFKPTQRTLSGSITEAMMDGKAWMVHWLTEPTQKKISAKPVITAPQATEVKTFGATKFGLVNHGSRLCLTISTVIAAIHAN